MAFRSDIFVDWGRSPRIITVAAPSTELGIQDLIDTLRTLEDDLDNLDDKSLLVASGKQDLGGGVLVGLTAQLSNAQVAFEARTTATSSGTASSADPTGRVLTDVAADFVTDGVDRGSTVLNFADGSSTTVLEVLSPTELLCYPLAGGSGNDWGIGDAYEVMRVIQCEIAGGNLVAVDELGAAISPVLPTAFTQVVRTSSSSATLQELEDMQYASFNGGVSVDVTSPWSGTTYPVGTPRSPVNNLTDAKMILTTWDLRAFFILGDITIDATGSYEGVTFVGEGLTKTVITVPAGANVYRCEFSKCQIQGVLDGNSTLSGCRIMGLQYVDGYVQACLIAGTITLSGAALARFLDCWSGIESGSPTIDMGGSGSSLVMRNFSGEIILENKTGPDKAEIYLTAGRVTIDHTVTAGTIEIGGVGDITNNSTGTAVVDATNLINPENVADAVWHRTITLPSPRRAEEVLAELHLLMGLDPLKPLVVTPTTRKVDTIIEQTIMTEGDQVTLTRS